MKRIAIAPILAIALALLSCSKDDGGSFFPPSVLLRLALPADLAPAEADCLDLVLTAPTGNPPRTLVGFGVNPQFLRIQPGGSRSTLIQFLEGSHPFLAATTEIEFNAGSGSGTDLQATFTVAATARSADGVADPEDRCNGGTILAQGAAQLDANGQPIRFPTKGRTTVEVPLVCMLPSGCGALGDGGAPGPDAGATDGGSTDGGT